MGEAYRGTREDSGYDGRDQLFEKGTPKHGGKEQQDGNEGKETGCQENEGPEENKGIHKEEVTRQMGMEK